MPRMTVTIDRAIADLAPMTQTNFTYFASLMLKIANLLADGAEWDEIDLEFNQEFDAKINSKAIYESPRGQLTLKAMGLLEQVG